MNIFTLFKNLLKKKMLKSVYKKHTKSVISEKTLHFHIVGVFPDSIDSYLNDSVLKRAQDFSYIKIHKYPLRNYTKDKHRKIDDTPYGGGPGMVLTVEPFLRAYEDAKKSIQKNETHKTIFFTPGGKDLTDKSAEFDAQHFDHIILLCGRYEGIDERVCEIINPEKLSIGNYILTSGELASLVYIDTVSRQIKGVLGEFESLEEKRISSHASYTKPRNLIWQEKNYEVPEVLMSGNHKLIDEWKSKN